MSTEKFDEARASEYIEQSRIALAGYEACHELGICMLASILGEGSTARILVVGAGGPGLEIVIAGKLEPGWKFLAVDPSTPMLELVRKSVSDAGLLARTVFRGGYVKELPLTDMFDAAIMFGVFHHVVGDQEKASLLSSISARLKPGSPFIISGNRYRYSENPVLLNAWEQRWRMKGTSSEKIKAKLATILQGADPPASNEVVEEFLEEAGFRGHINFFSSLFWSSWITFKER